MELITLSAPWILLLLTIVATCLLMFRRWKVAVGLLLLSVVGNWCFETLPLNLSHDTDGDLKVLSFNCNLSPKDSDIVERRARVIQFIREQDADVVFLTENFIVRQDSLWLEIQDEYPYSAKDNSSVGNRMYSKYPIVCDTLLKDKVMAYGITCCEIAVNSERLNVIGVHLSSNNYNEQMKYMTPDSVATGTQAHTYLKNIVTASEYREREARNLKDNLNLNPSLRELQGKLSSGQALPTIVMGDFNDVAGSPTLNVFESSGFKDAWWEGGFGYGATIHYPLPFRIDHILYNDKLNLRSIKKVDANGLSDHDALVATFSIK